MVMRRKSGWFKSDASSQRNVGRDLEQRFEHRNNAADDRGGDNPVADGKSALQSDHRPIICRGRKQIDRADKTESEGQNPNRYPDAKSGANQFATTMYSAASNRQR